MTGVKHDDLQRFIVVVVTLPLPMDKGMEEDHGAPEAGQLPRAWIRGREETESRQRARAQRVRSWTMQNETRGVSGQGSAGAAGRILDFANPSNIRT